MEMRVIWMPQALEHLDAIFAFYEEKSETAARKIINNLLRSSELLATFPEAGPVEPLLASTGKGFRSFVADKNHKLIYHIEKDTIRIIAVWDCRNCPEACKSTTFYDENDPESASRILHDNGQEVYQTK
ncbi:type II toxin-antitoxin system RelE/ParE family toxin [uncultured Bacteroides sp.]|uniref:type II toxin-antitoxin system RelE/ParE family toxin n=1 Tax=uncultured Bacteroides sp. TaxID=162156 RepID=UPI002AA7E44B|nr:type II toxin-antitoxin system RelE/ParE family toxin [uncultured Bacteroides sp.]